MYLARCSEEKGEIEDLLTPGEDSSGESSSSDDDDDESEESGGFEDGEESDLGNVEVGAEAGGPQQKLQ